MGFTVLPPEIIDRSCLYFIICIESHKQVGINSDLDIIMICMSHIFKVTIEHGSLMVGVSVCVWGGGGGEGGTFLFDKKALVYFKLGLVVYYQKHLQLSVGTRMRCSCFARYSSA